MKDSVTKSKVDHIDLRLGRRLKARRVLLEMTSQDLGEVINTTSQQIAKYEKGIDRVTSARLFAFSQALRVPILYFFDPNDEDLILESEIDAPIPKELLNLINSFCKIKGSALRKKTLSLIRDFKCEGLN